MASYRNRTKFVEKVGKMETSKHTTKTFTELNRTKGHEVSKISGPSTVGVVYFNLTISNQNCPIISGMLTVGKQPKRLCFATSLHHTSQSASYAILCHRYVSWLLTFMNDEAQDAPATFRLPEMSRKFAKKRHQISTEFHLFVTLDLKTLAIWP